MSIPTMILFSLFFIVAGVSVFQISQESSARHIRVALAVLSFGLTGLGSAWFVGVLLVIGMERNL